MPKEHSKTVAARRGGPTGLERRGCIGQWRSRVSSHERLAMQPKGRRHPFPSAQSGNELALLFTIGPVPTPTQHARDAVPMPML